jgi:hypothetical protein
MHAEMGNCGVLATYTTAAFMSLHHVRTLRWQLITQVKPMSEQVTSNLQIPSCRLFAAAYGDNLHRIGFLRLLRSIRRPF